MNKDTKIIKLICVLIMAVGAVSPWIWITLYSILKVTQRIMILMIAISVIATFTTCEIYDQMTMIEERRK